MIPKDSQPTVGQVVAVGVVAGAAYLALRNVQTFIDKAQFKKYSRTAKYAEDGGGLVAETLRAHGVKTIFTLCGGHISPILVACKVNDIKVIDVRHEATAAFAADAFSRLSGRVGVLAVTAGPGLTNTITAVKNAQLAQSPMIILSGAAPTLLKGRGSLQDIDQFACMRPHVKAFFSVNNLADAVPSLQKAFKIAQSGVPGPVCVEYPLDVLYHENIVRKTLATKKKPRGIQAQLVEMYVKRCMAQVFNLKDFRIGLPLPYAIPSHTRAEAVKVFSLLSKAKCPVILVGSQSVITHNCAESAKALRSLGIPTYLAGMARGLLGQNCPVQLRHKRREALREADVVVFFGVACDFRLDYGRNVQSKSTLISINRCKADVNQGFRTPNVKIVADPGKFLADLGDLASKQAPPKLEVWWNVLREREDARNEEIRKSAAEEGEEGCNPVNLMLKLEQSLPKDAVLVADGGDFVGTAAYTLQPRGPLHWLDPGSFGTLGVGGGFALAASIVYPESQVWLIWGDGSSAFSIAEYDTFVRHNLKVISLIGNDACWSQICRDQKEILKSDIACMLTHTDYHKVAEAWGAEGVKISHDSDIETQLQEAQDLWKQGNPVCINAILRPSEFRKGSISV